MKINNKNFRNKLVALAFGSLAAILPASASSITVSSISTSSTPNSIVVGSYDWLYGANNGIVGSVTSNTGLITFTGGTNGTEFGSFSAVGLGSSSGIGQSEVIDVAVKPTVSVNGGTAAATTVDFQGSIEQVGSTYELVFAPNGTQYCANTASGCSTTASGNVVNSGQTIVSYNGVNYAEITQNGVTYAVQATTTLSNTKGTFLNGFIGVAVTPEPSTYAMSGLAVAFLGFLARRKAKRS